MRFLNFDITRFKNPPAKRLNAPRGTWLRVWDWATGAWQADARPESRNRDCENPLLNSIVFACMRAIASDVAKLGICVKKRVGEIWSEVENSPYYRLLNNPNGWQTRVEFIMQWVLSLLHYGNTFVLVDFNGAGTPYRLTVLDPRRVQVLVSAETGEIFYRLGIDNQVNPLAEIFNTTDVYLPAKYIIHHKYMPLDHPLMGCPPLRVAALASSTGRRILAAHDELFYNGIVPPGILTVPEGTTEADMQAFSTKWAEFRRSGKTAVLDAAVKFEAISQKSIDSQALELLKYTNTDACAAFGVRPWKIGLEPMPLNAEQAQLSYFSDTLHIIIEEMEALIDMKLALPMDVWAMFDVSQLYRMDTVGRYNAASIGVKGGWLTPNEARVKADNLGPVEGGDTPYMQQQNFSLKALNKRDTAPAALAAPAAPTQGDPNAPADDTSAPADTDDSPPGQSDALQAVLGRTYKGVWKAGATWVAGDMVTRSGSLWVRLDGYDGDVDSTPPGMSGNWQLAVKRGSLK